MSVLTISRIIILVVIIPLLTEDIFCQVFTFHARICVPGQSFIASVTILWNLTIIDLTSKKVLVESFYFFH